MDETYIKVNGWWCYLYRAVDKAGATIDFTLSKNRDKKAAFRFFNKAIDYCGQLEEIMIDKNGANNSALKSINKTFSKKDKIEIRQIKYLNNLIESDYLFIKCTVKPMREFKAFKFEQDILIAIEMHHMLRKKQHKNSANIPVYEQFYALSA